jgi:hypothetical protein
MDALSFLSAAWQPSSRWTPLARWTRGTYAERRAATLRSILEEPLWTDDSCS